MQGTCNVISDLSKMNDQLQGRNPQFQNYPGNYLPQYPQLFPQYPQPYPQNPQLNPQDIQYNFPNSRYNPILDINSQNLQPGSALNPHKLREIAQDPIIGLQIPVKTDVSPAFPTSKPDSSDKIQLSNTSDQKTPARNCPLCDLEKKLNLPPGSL